MSTVEEQVTKVLRDYITPNLSGRGGSPEDYVWGPVVQQVLATVQQARTDETASAPIDPDTKAGMLAGLEQLRAQVWPGTESWQALPYSQLAPLAERACLVVEGLSANEVLLLGTFLAASARTQLQGEAGTS